MSRQKTLADREQYVVKANALIRKARYSLTAQQQKIVLFAISKIKPDDDIETEYTFNVNEFAEACGIKIRDGGAYYKRIRDDMFYLTERRLQIFPDGSGASVSWIGDISFPPGSAIVRYRFNRNMEQFLFALREQYTQYPIQNVLVFGQKNTIRLYEILRSYAFQRALDEGIERDVILSLAELKAQLEIHSYNRWADFDRCVLRPAINEINERVEDMHVEYEPIHGEHTRAIERINFIITRARAGQQLEAKRARRAKLDHNGTGGGAKK